MRPVLIVLIFIIVLIALIMAYLLIVSNTRSEKGGPTVFDMMMRNKDGSGEESEENGNSPRISKESEEDSPPTWEENRVDGEKQTEDVS